MASPIFYAILYLMHRFYSNTLRGVDYMLFKGTIIQKDNESFAVAHAAYEDLRSETSRTAYLELCKPYFSNLPIILVGEDEEGNFIYFGDTQLIQWLENQHNLSIQWESYGI